jgi:NitT/TauT family transport system permease protein
MSVTTSTPERVPLEARSHVRSGTKTSPSKVRRTSASLHTAGWLLPLAPPLVLGVLGLSSWYVGTTYGHVSSLVLPAPQDVLTSLMDNLNSGTFQVNALATIQESLLGFLLAVLVALPLGYGLAKSRLFAAAVQPYLAAGQAIPAIVIAPLLALWIGYGLLPTMILCALIVLFPMVITTVLGVQTIDPTLTDAARVEGASGWSLLANIEFPLALPAILAGVRTGLTLSITGALVGEFVIGGNLGLGALVLQAKEQYNMAFMFATLVILAVLAALYYSASWLLVKLSEIVY